MLDTSTDPRPLSPDPEILARVLSQTLGSLTVTLETIFHCWENDGAALFALQRVALYAAFDLSEACAALAHEFALPPDAAPQPATTPTPVSTSLDPPHAARHALPPPEAAGGFDPLLDGLLRVFVAESLVVHNLTTQVLRAWNVGAELSHEVTQDLHAHAIALRPPARRLLSEFDEGTRAADRADQEAERDAAERAEKERLLVSTLSFAGVQAPPASWIHIGWRCADDVPVALPESGGKLVLVAGVPGSGKSQAALTQIEGLLRPQPGLASARMPPSAVMAFHTDLSGVALPELLWSIFPNNRAADAEILRRRLGALPAPLPSVRLVAAEWLLPEFQARVAASLGSPKGLSLVPLRCHLGQLGAEGLAGLCGAVGDDDDARYLQAVLQDAQRLGDDLTVAAWRRLINERTGLNIDLRQRALACIAPLERLEAPKGSAGIWDLVEPGTLTVFALGGRWLGRREALPLISALMNGAAQPGGPHGLFHRLLHLDEVSRLLGDPRLWRHIVMTARQQRHWGTTLWLLGQDLMGLPDELIGLCMLCLVFRQGSPRMYQHLRQRLAGLRRCPFSVVSRLLRGQALLVNGGVEAPSRVPIWVRPPACAHGGHTVGVV